MGFTPGTLALRELMCGVLKNPAVNRNLAEHLGGLDVAYPGLDFPVSSGEAALLPDWTGRRLPDLDLRLEDGSSRRLYSALHEGRWLSLHPAEVTRPALRWEEPGWKPRTNVLHVSPAHGSKHLHGVGGMLVRPDGHVAWAWAA
ncbi:hypothetical protein ACLESO_23255 [Pyxidicoccus sp. 3LG]